MKGRPWTEAEVDALIGLMDQGASFVVAGRTLGRSMQAAKKKWASLTIERIGPLDVERPVIVPKERLVERRRRMSAPHRSLVGACLGDPPVGYSALDRRSDAPQPNRVSVYVPITESPPLQPAAPDERADEEDQGGKA